MASDLHRTATTTYLCCVPTLEDFAGAGRVGLAEAKIIIKKTLTNIFLIIFAVKKYSQ